MKEPAKKEERVHVIKSFSRRIGRRLTSSRKSDLSDFLPVLSIKLLPEKKLNPRELFNNNFDEFELEIGFGSGEHLIARALDNTSTGYIGCEPYLNGVARAVQLAKNNSIENLKFYPDDAQHVIDALPAQAIDKVMVLFPDPWPKKRHFIRRLINEAFLDKMQRILKTSGSLVIATDHEGYAEWITGKISEHGSFKLANENIKQFPANWHKSKYHIKAENNGLAPFYFEFIMK